MGAVAGAVPPAVIASAVAKGHTAEVGAHAHHHQPVFAFAKGPVFIGRGLFATEVLVARDRIGKIVDRGFAGRVDLFLRPVADEDRLAEPLNRKLAAFGDTRDVDADRSQRPHVRRGVHLVDQRPYGGTGRNDAGTGGRIVEEIPAGPFVIVCV
ncbi:hypothetical protein RB2654_14480 [Rhodobacterales bacterium HTCC2654]|uniref:Uncharacterized protein n=1 Tax=Maritimibacter alkaliphilus HTCC2654 TaxID=314271 RepID=A3VGU5_9RHOB|nr:hypothetical protein RB2654_14480 [Rhodobacterales bacterium HTCC2654] [Maritimibacter alkaliphilus HTCC2654]